MTSSWLHTITSYAVMTVAGYTGLTTIAASAVATHQETKIWRSPALPSLSLVGKTKVFLFNVTWMIGCLIGSIFISVKWLLSFGTSDIVKEANRLVENGVAKLCVRLFVGSVQVIGHDKHMPPLDSVPAPVYVANHASQIDVGAVYFLNRRFKWIAKQSVCYIPGVGQVMTIGQHVMIQRKKGANGKSVSNLFDKSNAAVQAGLPMFIFPQGTRRIAERLPAKEGAFIIAQTNQCTLIPVSINIPMTAWNTLYPLSLLWDRTTAPVVTITVHAGIPVTGQEDREALKRQCMDVIYSVLPKYEVDKEK